MAKKPIPPEDVIREESEPPITETEEPRKKNPDTVNVDIDDALIDEPKDDAFRKGTISRIAPAIPAPMPGICVNSAFSFTSSSILSRSERIHAAARS